MGRTAGEKRNPAAPAGAVQRRQKKTLFALAANLLELEDLRGILERLSEETAQLPLRERAVRAAALCREAATLWGIDLRLRKPPGKSGK
nr:hypothetical protein [uncultured Oscillibacter sp.]